MNQLKKTKYFISKWKDISQYEIIANEIIAEKDLFIKNNRSSILDIVDERIDFEVVHGNNITVFAVLTLSYYSNDI